MIDYLQGTVAFAGHDRAVIDVNGVGFSALMSTKGLASLPPTGKSAQIWTILSATDAGIALYGFASPEEREMFTKLVSVRGIGPKAALAILSTLSAAELAQAIAAEDDRRISTAPGIGKKSAQRIILELKGAIDNLPNLFSGDTEATPATPESANSEIVMALLGMGFTTAEIEAALRGYDGPANDVSAGIRYALQRLGADR